MIFNDILYRRDLPIYEVKELTMEEALLVLAAEKEDSRTEYCQEKANRYAPSDYQGVSSVAA